MNKAKNDNEIRELIENKIEAIDSMLQTEKDYTKIEREFRELFKAVFSGFICRTENRDLLEKFNHKIPLKHKDFFNFLLNKEAK